MKECIIILSSLIFGWFVLKSAARSMVRLFDLWVFYKGLTREPVLPMKAADDWCAKLVPIGEDHPVVDRFMRYSKLKYRRYSGYEVKYFMDKYFNVFIRVTIPEKSLICMVRFEFESGVFYPLATYKLEEAQHMSVTHTAEKQAA